MTEKEFMLTKILGCERADLFKEPLNLTQVQQEELDQMQSRLNAGEPLQYIIGEANFYGLNFKVDQRGLIPRPETEILVEQAVIRANELLKTKDIINILDVGTGSGCMAITLAKKIGSCRIEALDVSADALELSRENADLHQVAHKIKFVHDNMVYYFMDQIDQLKRFDIIVANPPYIKTNDVSLLPQEVQCEPTIALDGGESGMFFCRQIMAQSPQLLSEGGILYMEVGDNQREDIEKTFELCANGQVLSFVKDYRKIDRIVVIEQNKKFDLAFNQ